MYEGEMMVVDTPREIRSHIEGELIQIYPQDWQTAHDLIIEIPGVAEVQTYGEALHILVDSGQKRLPLITNNLKEHQIDYSNARIAPARMEEAFISLINRLDQERSSKEKE
jgi:hypothetical protein